MYQERGALTFFDSSNLEDDFLVDVSILTKNIQKICKTTRVLAKNFGIDEIKEVKEEQHYNEFKNFADNFWTEKKEKIDGGKGDTLTTEEAKPYEGDIPPELDAILNPVSNAKKESLSSLTYNMTLLNYSGVLDADSEFISQMSKVLLPIIILSGVISIVMLYTSFKMTHLERIKEFGMLSSIGMSKKQRKSIIRKEAFLLGTLGIACGIIIRTCYFIFIYVCDRYFTCKLYRGYFTWRFETYSR